MRVFSRLISTLCFVLLSALPAAQAQQVATQTSPTYSSNEVLDAGHRFFGGVSRGLASVIEKAASTWGQPGAGRSRGAATWPPL